MRENNALQVQSREHPDGWGIGWWGDDGAAPQLVRGAGAAYAEEAFTRHAEMVSSHAVLAHIRKASVGPVTLDNAHPFRWGPWLFAHNGTVTDFARHQARIEQEIDAAFAHVVIGDTDSARCFGIFLSRLARLTPDPTSDVPLATAARALAETVRTVSAITDPDAAVPSATTFLVGNGSLMLAIRRGRTLWYSTHKTRCPERGTCARFGPTCEAPPAAPGTEVNHMLIASERVSLEDAWIEVPVDGIVGVDAQMRLHRFQLGNWRKRSDSSAA